MGKQQNAYGQSTEEHIHEPPRLTLARIRSFECGMSGQAKKWQQQNESAHYAHVNESADQTTFTTANMPIRSADFCICFLPSLFSPC
ncbi:hypothetical protein niasHT_039422 [Heterodera trifolii]|uniref:Uncharacterized protein n=1 Tax=Heterodera trifolii TaxID=157864 RepID=A0ABD2J826_9BILA